MGGHDYTGLSQAFPIVLVVEDNPDLRRTAVDLFEETEVKSAQAVTGEEALAFLQDHAPDVRLIFTERELPGRVDGIDLARVASLRWPWIKVLVPGGKARVSDVPQNVTFLPERWSAVDILAQLHWEEARARASAATLN